MVAGSLTYTSLLAMVPLLTVTITLTSHFAYTRDLGAQVRAFALKNLVPDVAGKVIGVYMEQFAQNASRLTAIGLIIIVATAVALLFTIDSAFNDIWRAKRRRAWWVRLAAYLAVLAVAPMLIAASLALTSTLVHWTQHFDRNLPFLDDWLLAIVPFAMTTLAIVVAYRVMPSRHVPTRHAIVGGIVAGLMFEIVKYVFVVFVIRVPTYSMVYGAFASVPIFLAWLFCCWMVVLIGAEIAATLSYFRHNGATYMWPTARPNTLPFAEALKLLDVLAMNNEGTAFQSIRLRAPMPIDTAEDILHALTAANIVRQEKRGYRLALSRDAIADEEVVRALNAL